MSHQYSKRQRKRLELYFRCLTASCLKGTLQNYYVAYEFGLMERLVRKSVIRDVLKTWSIQDAESLKRKIRWLLDDGDREEYLVRHRYLTALTGDARSRYLETIQREQGEKEYAKWDVVNKCLHQLPSGDVSAYGGAWAVMLSRVGVSKGFLSKEEAWEIKLEAATLLQNKYNSWKEFYCAYLCGSHYFDDKPGITKYLKISAMYDLLAEGTLLYRKLDWKEKLLPE
ncbi:DUF1266 domain-containing protein [Paenibacillus sp. alder61]|uniref:DUF1266 domain-containing protein n=1 Tax=Paenibacillus faecis TaxID=862114 RepID=A0A5D0CLI7_9BACL|nr:MULTISPECIES: DUF1266 domain-containing protein [Paenibacillus]MCA1292865.1 DUF1266 domain-containing protein [Paenibacillus sp. alder61]TYA10711.1 DUF1266 domain-containing protein [Paenibacillus faecis]